MAANYEKGLYKEYELLLTEMETLKLDYSLLKKENQIFQAIIKANEKLVLQLEKEKTANELLAREVLRLNGLLNTDGTNSGLPTSKTHLSKAKVIPNSREATEKKIGGQVGHPQNKMKAFEDKEVTETQEHNLEECPHCGGDMEKTEETIQKDELDYEVVVIKKRHLFSVSKCKECGCDAHVPIPNTLKEENQYGSHVPALSLALMNIGNVSVNKVKKMIYGLSEEEINPSEGYIIKQQKQASKKLITFVEELKRKCQTLDILYWDDTVIDINKTRGCLRFYGNDNIALYVAHKQKNKLGIDKDGILKILSSETAVMHDHNMVNYNKEYSFINIECNAHLLRDLQKTSDNLAHNWSVKLKELLANTNKERNKALGRNEDAFEDDYVKKFYNKFNEIILEGIVENRKDDDKYFGKDEKTLLNRILKFKDNYLSWVVNFSLPFTNNLSERSLRGIKSKMKISGQFQSVETAQHYASIKSYIETCYRNGINEMKALIRLCEGNPYTVDEIFNKNSGV